MNINILLRYTTFTLGIAFMPSFAYATELSSHQHGFATLALAVEAETIEIQFTSPAYDLVGFEHQASTKEQILAVQRAEKILNEPQKLFTFVDAKCSQKSANIDMASLAPQKAKKHDKDHHAHEHEKHDHEHVKKSHSEVVATYTFKCESSKNLKSITLDLFSKFPSIEKIKAMWITETQQNSNMLTKESNTIRMR